ncbi:CsbD family protein [Francisella sp. SYW-9]|uniref:CsbD family protein n=1 Tax=Francisella sp. SYW-9 TaxID=2610888 RepID=UPI00123E16BC|nr:CsbD family protein [Francisella sp. SYW-9]
MNKHQVQGKWEQVKAKIKEKYADFTDDELLQVEADSEKLVGYLQEKYGMTKEKAREEASKFKDSL